MDPNLRRGFVPVYQPQSGVWYLTVKAVQLWEKVDAFQLFALEFVGTFSLSGCINNFLISLESGIL